MEFDELFPHVKRSVEDFLFDEEGNIARSRVLVIGSMMVVLSMMLAEPVFAAHRTHSSHRTHSTHRTHSSHRSGGHMTHFTHSTHSTHSTHGTHNTHSNHSTHSTHSNHATHSNHSTHSNAAPTAYELKVSIPETTDTVAALSTEELSVSLGAVLPVNENDTIGEISSIVANINIPPDTPSAK